VFRFRPEGKFLTPQQAGRVYDRIGRFQDWQILYEGSAIRELVRLGSFETAKSVFEFGCGTGAFAEKIMKIVSPECRYVGLDVSPAMNRLANRRLQRWADRASVKLGDGSSRLPERDRQFDRFVSNYVFDLLSPEYAAAILGEAHRVLNERGKLCLVSSGSGISRLSRVVTALWERIWTYKPALVGGCRPVDLQSMLASDQWSIEHHKTVISFGITSEVVVASRR